MRKDKIVVRDNIGDNTRLVKKVLEEVFRVSVAAGAVHSRDDGVAGEDSGSDIGKNSVASYGRGGIEISGTN